MIRVMLACDGAKPMSGQMCPMFEPPAHVKFEEADGWIDATLDEHGWATRGDEHYCPRHNPAERGEIVEVGVDYIELAPGLKVRVPHDHFGARLEILREKASG